MGTAEIAACAAVAIACALVVARTTRGAARLGLFAMLGLSAGAAAAARPRPAREPAGLPRPSHALGYVGSAACLPCHAGEHASFGRTFHRTMTQAATAETVLAPFERRGDDVFYEGKRVVMTTGSHREQAYWTAGERPGDLAIVPVVWMVEAKALLPRRGAFVFPPDAPMPPVHWGSSCIACHAVAGEPRRDRASDAWDTRASELGIACEACHGPGEEHVAQYRDPVARYMHAANKHVVQPAKLSHDRANAVCGQCHAYAFPRDEEAWWQTGYALSFRAGDALAPSRIMLSPAAMKDPRGPAIDTPPESIFWPDGDARVGGREYNGLVASRCRATCVDCHAMHAGEPAGQLKPNASCTTTCHASAHDRDHGEHPAAVTCVDCHMPKTSFALLGAVRSHRISVPAVHGDGTKPSACELCHLDRGDVGLRAALAGDAGLRAIVADALGRAPAAFAAPILDAMAADPYTAVRFVAARSRARFGAGGPPLDPALVAKLVAQRDDRPVTIAE